MPALIRVQANSRRSRRAGVLQAPREETAECSDVIETFTAMAIYQGGSCVG
jgi:hypothetical protein